MRDVRNGLRTKTKQLIVQGNKHKGKDDDGLSTAQTSGLRRATRAWRPACAA